MQYRLLQAAHELVDRGFWVFPCRPMAKEPRPNTNWRQASTRDHRQLDEWWMETDERRRPIEWNPAVDCAKAGVIVLDLDKRHEGGHLVDDGALNFTRLLQELGLPLHPETLTTITPSGGRHVWFLAPEGQFGNGTGRLPSAIDVRGHGGYVLGPGAMTRAGIYRIQPGRDLPIAPLPEALLDLLRPEAKVIQMPGVPRQFTPDRGEAYGQAALVRECRSIEGLRPGERNGELYRAACRVGSLVGAGLLSDPQDCARMLETANSQMADPLPAFEAESAIRRGLDWGIAHPRTLALVPPNDIGI